MVSARRVRVRTAGRDLGLRPLLMLPGLGLSGRYLLPFGGLMAEDRRVLTPDPPGFGRSDEPGAEVTVAAMADVLADWLVDTCPTPVDVVGNSMGCQIGAELAARHGDLVAGLVLQGATVDPAARSIFHLGLRTARVARHEAPSLGPVEMVDWARTGPRRVFRGVQAMMTHRLEDTLPSVRCPTLVVLGAHDSISTRHWAHEVVALLPHGDFRLVPGAAHAMPYTHPLELARVVRPFLAAAER
jgi:2-hydroxy-6-oxonona-2,4-dienedioate hydrolase